jgi:hypothetical protein
MPAVLLSGRARLDSEWLLCRKLGGRSGSATVFCAEGDFELQARWGHRAAVGRPDALMVSLQNIVEFDDTIRDLADLPVGWHAFRTGGRCAFLERRFPLS